METALAFKSSIAGDFYAVRDQLLRSSFKQSSQCGRGRFRALRGTSDSFHSRGTLHDLTSIT